MQLKSGKQLTATLVLMASLLWTAASSAALEQLLEEARSDDYIPPASDQIREAEQGFKRWFIEVSKPAYEMSPAGIEIPGFQHQLLPRPSIEVWAEKADKRQGRGFFAARIQSEPGAKSAPLMIQAPHQYYDLRTGTLAEQLFLESDALAAAWNTAHRYHGEATDLVHIADSYLHALSRAFIAVYPEGRLLQLHGFSNAKRSSLAGRSAQAILSDGTKYPTKKLAELTACLSKQLNIRALLYPRDLRELGATTNTLAADLRRQGFSGFIHLEMNPELRKRLIADEEARGKLMQCLKESGS